MRGAFADVEALQLARMTEVHDETDEVRLKSLERGGRLPHPSLTSCSLVRVFRRAQKEFSVYSHRLMRGYVDDADENK